MRTTAWVMMGWMALVVAVGMTAGCANKKPPGVIEEDMAPLHINIVPSPKNPSKYLIRMKGKDYKSSSLSKLEKALDVAVPAATDVVIHVPGDDPKAKQIGEDLLMSILPRYNIPGKIEVQAVIKPVEKKPEEKKPDEMKPPEVETKES
jgi:hypothetical protein